MRVLIGCEFSGTVRRAFAAQGHDAWSCDLLPADDQSGNHIVGDVCEVLGGGWDLAIFHPPCTYLTNAANRWLFEPCKKSTPTQRWQWRDDAIAFWLKLKAAPIPRKAFENPQPHPYVLERVGPETQRLQPWQFGHLETKGTWLWLENLEPLAPTGDVRDAMMALPYRDRAKVHSMAPGPDRSKERSRFFSGIASAMAATWSMA